MVLTGEVEDMGGRSCGLALALTLPGQGLGLCLLIFPSYWFWRGTMCIGQGGEASASSSPSL